jgi:tRNA-dihydrouridine synthase B
MPGLEREMNRHTSEGNHSIFEEENIILAPMSGITDAPFRMLCFEQGADVAVSEMISSEGLVRGGGRTFKLMEKMDGEGKLGVQIFGSDPGIMAEAASIAEGTGPVFIDINFGCPARKVTKKNCGVALMRDLELMGEICRRVVEAVKIPVTGKIRSGWSGGRENYIRAGKVLQDSGVAAVVIHPRHKQQGFTGEARWDQIAELNHSLSIPVIANGDVMDSDDCKRIIGRTGCRAVMIGRGALGNPWIFREIKQSRRGEEFIPVSLQQKIDVILRQVRMEVGWKGERRGVLEMRKHYQWYLRGLYGMRKYRAKLSQSRTLDEVTDIFETIRKKWRIKWKLPA